MEFPGQPGKKVMRQHINGKKLNVVVHTCNHSNSRKCKIGRFLNCISKITRAKQKGLEVWLKW
jgi:transcription initiation factor TFIIIB Brf1 subunit/transcription initiation factor TFIIB